MLGMASIYRINLERDEFNCIPSTLYKALLRPLDVYFLAILCISLLRIFFKEVWGISALNFYSASIL